MILPTWVRAMPARDSAEEHRASTPLELFLDLCFVVAIAQAASSLHHAFDEAHFRQALLGYPMVFFAIWWAWMNFTWFASAYDNDDVVFRLCVFVQVAGVLVLAAGVPRAFADQQFGLVVVGYVIMRTGLVVLWLRAAVSDPPRRRTNLRYVTGLVVVQLGWIAMVFLPASGRIALFVGLVVCELSVPVWAERYASSPWHPDHIAERYGLFTIIVLGETVLAATVAVQVSLDAGSATLDVLGAAVGGVLIVCSMWWIYFAQPAEQVIERARDVSVDRPRPDSFVWGYGHYVVYASAAAVGAGIAVVVDQITHHAELSERASVEAVAVPVALYVLSVWMLHRRVRGPLSQLWAYPVVAALVLLGGLLGLPVEVTGVLMALLVLVSEVVGRVGAGDAAPD